jgi:hypothetical protein
MKRCGPACALAVMALLAAGRCEVRGDEIVLANKTRLQGKVLNPKCVKCGGRGKITCDRCGGAGRWRAPDGRRPLCPACKGAGTLTCPDCGGLGATGKQVRIKLGAGVLTTLERKEVVKIIWKHIDPEALVPVRVNYRKRVEGMDAKSAKQQFELGTWCAEKKLYAEARKHLEAAAKLDAKAYRKRAEPYLKELNRRREKAAVKAMLAALSLLERKGPEQGAPALRAVMSDFPDAEVVRRGELQRDLIRQHFPKLLAAGTDTLEKILRGVADKAAAECPACKGTGRSTCPTCRGTGRGKCTACAGSGKRTCPVCRGTLRLTCPKCFGRGKLKGGTIGYGQRRCPTCGGTGEIACDFCGGRGKVACRHCGGTGEVAGACPTCRGAGKVTCVECLGTGVRKVVKYKWGPPPVRQAGVVNVVGPGERSRAWQGDLSGGTLTVVPAEVIWRGALSRNVEKLAGKKLRLVTVAIDNRKGTKLLRFRPASGTLRGVTLKADQVKMSDLSKLLAAKRDDKRAVMVAAAAGRTDCLPGAYVCVLVAFPQDTNLAGMASLFWVQGTGEPAKLTPIWLSADEVAQLRKSLR